MLNNDFFCRLCHKSHEGHDDLCIQDNANDIQSSLNDLKQQYLLKRTHIIDRLVNHQGTIEYLFSIFYETLDAERKRILEEEYSMRHKMDSFEDQLKVLLDRTQGYTTTEFFHERFEI